MLSETLKRSLTGYFKIFSIERVHIYIQATENSEQWVIANKILDSFKFVK